MSKKFYLASASNTLPPIYYLLKEKGYTIRVENTFWVAENETTNFCSEDLLMLAGLVFLYENKGEDWRIDDEKIEEFGKKYPY
ncbi:MAG: hypothetical protein JNN28_12900 [Saprospiraceae bacterium]|nr:hypothetical protein [Saprospiraceae bacterium]